MSKVYVRYKDYKNYNDGYDDCLRDVRAAIEALNRLGCYERATIFNGNFVPTEILIEYRPAEIIDTVDKYRAEKEELMENNKIKCCESGDKCISEYNRGAADMLKAVKKIQAPVKKGGFRPREIEELFGRNYATYCDIYNSFSPTEIIEKIAEYEEKKEKKTLHVGDVVRSLFDCETLGVVISLCQNRGCGILWSDGSCDTYPVKDYEDRKIDAKIDMTIAVFDVLKALEH